MYTQCNSRCDTLRNNGMINAHLFRGNKQLQHSLSFVFHYSFFILFCTKMQTIKTNFCPTVSFLFVNFFFLFHISQCSSLHTCFVKVFFEVTKRYCAWLLRHLRRVVPFPHLKSVVLSLLKETEQNDHIN